MGGRADGRATGSTTSTPGVFAGVWERETLLEYGGWDEGWARNQDSEMAGRFLARGERLICLPQMAAALHAAELAERRCGGSTSGTASTG